MPNGIKIRQSKMDFIFINRYLGGLESMDFSRLRGGQQVRVAKAACTGEFKVQAAFCGVLSGGYMAADSV